MLARARRDRAASVSFSAESGTLQDRLPSGPSAISGRLDLNQRPFDPQSTRSHRRCVQWRPLRPSCPHPRTRGTNRTYQSVPPRYHLDATRCFRFIRRPGSVVTLTNMAGPASFLRGRPDSGANRRLTRNRSLLPLQLDLELPGLLAARLAGERRRRLSYTTSRRAARYPADTRTGGPVSTWGPRTRHTGAPALDLHQSKDFQRPEPSVAGAG